MNFPTTQAAERRGAPRMLVQTAAQIVVASGASIKCVIHDLSTSGANIEVHGLIPQTFHLMFYDNQPRRACRVVWRKGNRLGVRFE